LRELIVHIGHPKTGTSYFQDLLDGNKLLLEQEGIYYPQFTRKFFSSTVQSGNGYLLLDKSFVLKDKTVLSNESLFRFIDRNNCRDLLLRHNCKTTVLLVVREPVEYLYSLWSQALKKHGYTKTFANYLKTKNLDQFSIICNWIRMSEEFGFQLKLIKYTNNVIDELLELIKINKKKLQNIPQSSDKNRSLTKEENTIVRKLNKSHEYYGHLYAEVLESLEVKTKDKYIKIDDEVMRYLSKILSNDLSFINKYLSQNHKLALTNRIKARAFINDKDKRTHLMNTKSIFKNIKKSKTIAIRALIYKLVSKTPISLKMKIKILLNKYYRF